MENKYKLYCVSCANKTTVSNAAWMFGVSEQSVRNWQRDKDIISSEMSRESGIDVEQYALNIRKGRRILKDEERKRCAYMSKMFGVGITAKFFCISNGQVKACRGEYQISGRVGCRMLGKLGASAEMPENVRIEVTAKSEPSLNQYLESLRAQKAAEEEKIRACSKKVKEIDEQINSIEAFMKQKG